MKIDTIRVRRKNQGNKIILINSSDYDENIYKKVLSRVKSSVKGKSSSSGKVLPSDSSGSLST